VIGRRKGNSFLDGRWRICFFSSLPEHIDAHLLQDFQDEGFVIP